MFDPKVTKNESQRFGPPTLEAEVIQKPQPAELKTEPRLATASPAQDDSPSLPPARVLRLSNTGPEAPPSHIQIIGLGHRVDEAAGLLADNKINKKFEEYRQSSLTTKSGFLAKLGRVATAPLRPNTYKAAWLRMTADAKRVTFTNEVRNEVFNDLTSGNERDAALSRVATLEEKGSTKGEFGEVRVNTPERDSRVEMDLRHLAKEYLMGAKDAATFEDEKKAILEGQGVRHAVDNTLTVLNDIRKGAQLSESEATAALDKVSFGIWNDSSAAGEKLRKGFGARLVAACHGSRILGTVPGITAVTATAVSVGVYLAKGGFGTRQLAVGALSGVGTSLALGAAVASAPVLSGLVIGTAVASVFAALRKGKELRKDLHQVRTEKVLGQHKAANAQVSPKDTLFREKFMNTTALNVQTQIAALKNTEDLSALARAIGQTDAALQLQNDPKRRGNTLDYTNPAQIARERLELIRALANARKELKEGASGDEATPALENEVRAATDSFKQDYLAKQSSVDGSFATHRRGEQAKALVTTLVVGGTVGGLFYGAGRAVDALEGYWHPTHPAAGATPSTAGSASHAAPSVSAPATTTLIVDKAPPVNLSSLPAGVSRAADGTLIVDGSKVSPDVLAQLKGYNPKFTSTTVQQAVATQDRTHTVTEYLTSKGAGSARGGTLAREYHYDNGTRAFDKNELRLNWGGAAQKGVDTNGNVVYSVKRMFKEDSHLFQGGKKVSLDVHDAVANAAARAPAQGKLELVLRLDANHSDQIVRIPIKSDGSIVIPDEVKRIAYSVNKHGQAEYVGWKASIGLVTENPDGKVSFGEIATDFGSKKLNGSTFHETIAGKPGVVEYRFPVVKETKIVEVQPATPVPVDEGTPVVPPLPPTREWIFPMAWEDHRNALGAREKYAVEPPPVPVTPREQDGDDRYKHPDWLKVQTPQSEEGIQATPFVPAQEPAAPPMAETEATDSDHDFFGDVRAPQDVVREGSATNESPLQSLGATAAMARESAEATEEKKRKQRASSSPSAGAKKRKKTKEAETVAALFHRGAKNKKGASGKKGKAEHATPATMVNARKSTRAATADRRSVGSKTTQVKATTTRKPAKLTKLAKVLEEQRAAKGKSARGAQLKMTHKQSKQKGATKAVAQAAAQKKKAPTRREARH